MLKLTLEQKKKGIKEEFTYVNSNGRMSKQYTYKGMYITWDNQILHGKWNDYEMTELIKTFYDKKLELLKNQIWEHQK